MQHADLRRHCERCPLPHARKRYGFGARRVEGSNHLTLDFERSLNDVALSKAGHQGS